MSEVYIGPSQVFTGGQDFADAVLLWALVFFFFFLMQHNICYQQPLLVFKRLMLSTSFHFVPPLQSGIVFLVNFVDVKISVKLPTLFFVLCVY